MSRINWPSAKQVHIPTDLQREVIKKDPEWPRTKDWQREYVFNGPKGERVFEANVTKRGPYKPA